MKYSLIKINNNQQIHMKMSNLINDKLDMVIDKINADTI